MAILAEGHLLVQRLEGVIEPASAGSDLRLVDGLTRVLERYHEAVAHHESTAEGSRGL